ncbi:hypothetical protein BJ508DRAFT_332135 [Ascobolus immersus RN42]|uniref:Uncharacterized protein n=1 Tax=Ascobolus immersus RN42 TaxID=1160509 RepID=A0A3N4HR06_ASCIM|nr:hypothetical protein BJ508DRAFT_332135 [Ascobolus immersus RN42]
MPPQRTRRAHSEIPSASGPLRQSPRLHGSQPNGHGSSVSIQQPPSNGSIESRATISNPSTSLPTSTSSFNTPTNHHDALTEKMTSLINIFSSVAERLQASQSASLNPAAPAVAHITANIAPNPSSSTSTFPADTEDLAILNDPRIRPLKARYPRLDIKTVKQIMESKFRPENILRLRASNFTSIKDRDTHSSGSLILGGHRFETQQPDVKLEEYHSLLVLLQPFLVYCQCLVRFAPPALQLDLSEALWDYMFLLIDLNKLHTWDSVRDFHIAFHYTRLDDVYDAEGWRKRDMHLEFTHLRKRDEAAPSRRPTSQPQPLAYCIRWNRGDFCQLPCKYTHRCSSCNSPLHTAKDCRRFTTQNSNHEPLGNHSRTQSSHSNQATSGSSSRQ